MKVLAFDTSSKTLAVALLDHKAVLGQFTLNIKKNHSITLMPAIDFLLKNADLSPTDLDRIVVAQGPGSYTGLRIAVATAKMLAHTLQIDLVGISSLLALIPVNQTGVYISLIDARRNHVYAGFYEEGSLIQEEAHLPFELVLEKAARYKEVTFVGEVTAFVEQIKQALPQARFEETFPDAVQLAKVGLELPAVSGHDFVPRYLKRVEAEENWLKDHQEEKDSYIKRL